MMEFINDISTETVLELIKNHYRQTTGKVLQIGSDEFALASVIAYIFGVLVQKFNAQARQRYLSTATGEYLDAIGETFDISRPHPIHASCTMNIEISEGVTLTHGEFIVTDKNGISFTPAVTTTLAISGEMVFVGMNDDDVLSENNIGIGEISQIKTPIAGVLSVSNITVSGGARDEFPNTEEGDERYRHYIYSQRSSISDNGTAAAYEQRAIKADARILDAYCLRYQDAGWEAGKAKIYILTKEQDPDVEKEIVNRVTQSLSNDTWRPVCDIVEVYAAKKHRISPVITVALTSENAISGREKFEKDMAIYVEFLESHLGGAFNLSELCKLTQTPDANGVKTEYLSVSIAQYNYMTLPKTSAFTVEWSVQQYVVV